MSALSNYVNSARTGTPQSVPTPGRNEVKNSAGGYVYEVSDQQRLERFLILGTEGTYYATEQQVSQESVDFLIAQIRANEEAVLNTIVETSVTGRAYRNTPAIVALALVLIHGKNKKAVDDAVSKVVRTATHLYEFVNTIDALGGWGPAKKRAVSRWFTDRDADSLAYQSVKYRSRTI
jgi:60 kDa SS-A/Ro ribonucleoprotein